MRRDLYKEIGFALIKLKIIPTEALADKHRHLIEESATNQFLKIKATNGKSYLIRINGVPWPPFTREDESRNLNELKRHKISTNVIYNDPGRGFQICEYLDRNHASNHAESLDAIAQQINKIHESCNFKGKYPLFSTVENSYKGLSSRAQDKYKYFYQIIISLLKTIHSDSTNFVSSHNDLLPTSVYLIFGRALFVDFECSGINHRAYDLALFALKMNLTAKQETKLITSYDSEHEYGVDRSFHFMKPIVGFLLLCWSGTRDGDTQFKQSMSTVIFKKALNIALQARKIGLVGAIANCYHTHNNN